MLYWLIKLLLAEPVVKTVFRPRVHGLGNVPAGGAILASNHLAFSDPLFLPVVVPRRITFIAKSEYFTGRGVRGRLTAGFFRGIGQLPVDRSGGGASRRAIDEAVRVLAAGELFGIYPEGTRSPDGRLYRGRTGVARIALESGAPVVPVAMIGTDLVQPAGTRLPRVRRVSVVVGRPLDFSRYAGRRDDRFVLRSVTDEIMYEIMKLSGQEYVDVYAAEAKRAPGRRDGTAGGAPGGRTAPGR
ncbi:lysophospholipid acyltransferase family protein [Kineococcus glutinatus]|uniref:Lysophospholipid acyltransferase family protein n=1 Tax=Kineococcus glutinatus TaxID=1070872 RepID=A0ABP9HDI0_9ACTN